jgi:translation initiation factor 1
LPDRNLTLTPKTAMPDSRLVYSTELGRTCPQCRQAVADCRCGALRRVAVGDGIVRVSRQNKGRGGKTVTVVSGVALDADALAALGKRLRTACGAGGTAKDGVLEVQGDHVERVMALLAEAGWAVKRSGG